MPTTLRKHIHHVDKRLQFRLRIYFLLSAIFIGIFLFNLIRGALRVDYGFIGLFAGVGIGVLTSRMFHTSWSKDAKKVVSRLDVFGIAILAVYIVFEIFLRERIVGYFTHDVQVGMVGFAVLAGTFYGRFLGTHGKIIKILKEQGIL